MTNTMLDEYLKLTDIVSNFDSSLITVKSWGVTLGLVAIGLGFKEKTWGYFLLAAICGISFWIIEFTLKGHQIRYFPRMREIEYQMAVLNEPHAPRIDWSWSNAEEIFNSEQPSAKAQEVFSKKPTLMEKYPNWKWHERMTMTHIMFPHIFTVTFGLAFAWLAYNKKGRFRSYGP